MNDRVVVLGILIRGERVLLVKRAAARAFFPGVWDLPGGHSEEEEAPAQTLQRELGEELGIVPTEYQALSGQPLNAEGLRIHCYWVRRWSGTPINLQEHEHSEIAWTPFSEVDKLELASSLIPTLLQAVRDLR